MPWVNHIANPGGETTDSVGGSVIFWQGNSATVTRSTAQALDGTASVQLVSDAAGDAAYVPFVWPGTDGGPVLFQAYVYHPSTPATGTQVTIRTRGTFASIAGVPNPQTSVANAWTRVSGTITPTAAMVPGSAYLFYVRAGGAGTLWIDRAAVWQGNRDDALAWSAQVPLFVVEVAPGYGRSDLFNPLSPLVFGDGGTAPDHRVGTPWVDVTWRVRSGSWRGGRASELEQTQATTANLTLDNRDGALDPTTGTMGSVGMPIRIRYTDPSTRLEPVLQRLFEGQVWSVRPVRNGPNDQTVELAAADRWKAYSMATINTLGTVADDSVGEVGYLFLRDEVGDSRAQSSYPTMGTAKGYAPGEQVNALEFMQTLARTEGGRLLDHPFLGTYIEGRHLRHRPAGTAAVFGTATGEIPYTTVEPIADDSYLFNDWTVTANGGSVSATVTDATSTGLYGKRSQSLEVRLGTARATLDATDAAGYYAALYANPRLRIPTIKPNLMPMGTAAPWRKLIDSWRATYDNSYAQEFGGTTSGYSPCLAVKRPVLGSSGGTATHVVWAEGARVDWAPGVVSVEIDVSPVTTGWWRLDEGQLDSTTRLAW